MTITLPDLAAPKPIAEATDALRQAEAQLEAVRTARQEAESGLREAEVLDREALARRLIADPEARPSREHRDQAESALSEAEEVEAAALQNAEGASERAASVVFEYLSAWREGVERARRKSDSSFAKALSRLQEAEAERAELRGVDAWLKQLRHGGRSWLVGGAGGTAKAARGAMPLPGQLDLRDPRNADSKLSVAYALELLSGYAHESSVEGECEAEQRRLAAERAAEERQERMRQMHASAVQPH
jgi:hypothetical protein